MEVEIIILTMQASSQSTKYSCKRI